MIYDTDTYLEVLEDKPRKVENYLLERKIYKKVCQLSRNHLHLQSKLQSCLDRVTSTELLRHLATLDAEEIVTHLMGENTLYDYLIVDPMKKDTDVQPVDMREVKIMAKRNIKRKKNNYGS